MIKKNMTPVKNLETAVSALENGVQAEVSKVSSALSVFDETVNRLRAVNASLLEYTDAIDALQGRLSGLRAEADRVVNGNCETIRKIEELVKS